MHRNTLAFVIVAAIGGFIGGFWLANSLNRTAMTSPGVASNTVNSNTAGPAEDDLSPDEIRAKLEEADRNAGDFTFQKDLGIALYRYAATKQNVALFKESVRLLERADSLRARDFDVLVALGNGHFDIGFFERDAKRFQTAREVYTKALAVKPDDLDVQTDFGITYFLQEPAEYDKAIAQFKKVLATDPEHVRSMQFLTRTYTRQGNLVEAEKTLERIRSINPANPAITELSREIAAARSGALK